MKITPLLVLIGILAAVVLTFIRLEEVRKLDSYYNLPKVGDTARDRLVRIASYKVSPRSIPLGQGNLDFRGCWAEAEMQIPFLGWGDNHERTGKVRLILETEDGANSFGVEQRLKIGGEYGRQAFVQDSISHRLVWRTYDNDLPRIVLVERRTEEGQVAVSLVLTRQ